MSEHPVQLAGSERDLAACFPVMAQLRPHLTLESFVARVRSQENEGYRVAFLTVDDEVVAVAGFRLVEMLAHGRFLYVDDLVSDERARSRGHGSRLLDWLLDRARAEGCSSLQLDSGVQRLDAHRFYDREGFTRAGYHFSKPT